MKAFEEALSLSSTLSKINNSVFFIWQKPWFFGKYFFHVTDSR